MKKIIISFVLTLGIFVSGGAGFNAALEEFTANSPGYHPGPEPVELIQESSLDFGIIRPPSSGSQDFEITPKGSLKLGMRGDGQFVSGQSTGSVIASGVQFNVTAEPLKGTCTVLGTALTQVQVHPESGVSATGIRIGGHLKVDAHAKGSGTCEYILTANYN